MRTDAECVQSDPKIGLSLQNTVRIYRIMRIPVINMTLEIRRVVVINMVTNAMGTLYNNHKTRIVRVDLMGDDRSRAPTAGPRGMKIVDVGRDLRVRSTAVKYTRRKIGLTSALLVGSCMEVAIVTRKNFTI